MRIVQITPGTGNFHCGNCLRDAGLVAALRRMGHDVTMVPLYLPHVVDGPDLSDGVPIFFGGINAYLQNKSVLFRHTPRWLDHWLDRPRLLRKVADLSGMTAARDLGELTLSMIAGEEGHQNKELTRLIEFLAEGPRPDVVCLSNTLLVGLARRIKAEVGAKIVCTLYGEDAFLDSLIEPYRTRAWERLRERVADPGGADAFIAVSRYYGELMSRRLELAAERVHIVPNGIDPTDYAPAPPPPRPPEAPTIGYLARMHPCKGLATLIDAFVRLHERMPDARLRIAGAVTPSDAPFVKAQRQRIDRAGLTEAVEFLPNLDAGQKRRFLASLSVLSVPATYGEAFGLYLIESWAAGVPVVQPRHAAFPELIERSGGGILCHPDDPADLAQALESLLSDPAGARRMGEAGRRAVVDFYNADRMARDVIEVCESVCTGSEVQGSKFKVQS